MLHDALLEDYIEKFYGYGRWDATFWFVGMEEACHFSVKHINHRLEEWRKRQKKPLESMEQFAPIIGCNWHGEDAKLQPTWGKLIRVLFAAKGRTGHEVSHATLLQYQRRDLGTHTGETCLAELLPLPSPGMSFWFYGQNSDIPFLKTRELYKEHLWESRIRFLADRLAENVPKVVVFYGKSYSEAWKKISGMSFTEGEIVQTAVAKGTRFYIMRHLTRYEDIELDSIGRLIHSHFGR